MRVHEASDISVTHGERHQRHGRHRASASHLRRPPARAAPAALSALAGGAFRFPARIARKRVGFRAASVPGRLVRVAAVAAGLLARARRPGLPGCRLRFRAPRVALRLRLRTLLLPRLLGLGALLLPALLPFAALFLRVARAVAALVLCVARTVAALVGEILAVILPVVARIIARVVPVVPGIVVHVRRRRAIHRDRSSSRCRSPRQSRCQP